jgi:adenylate cyclase, class 2
VEAGAQRENEIKLAIAGARAGRALLRRAGFRVSTPRVLETNTVFDTPELLLRRAKRLLRVRQAGKRATVTYKGPPDASRHKSREEIETAVADAGAMAAIARKVGFEPVFRYEKYRTEYKREPGGVATLDETPIGIYIELEGPPEWVDAVTAELGFAPADQITASYGALYREWCERQGVTPGYMVFQAAE